MGARGLLRLPALLRIGVGSAPENRAAPSPSADILRLEFFFSSRRRHTRCGRDWSSDVCSSDLLVAIPSAAKDRLREIVEQAKKTGLPVRILPGLLEMADGKVSLRQAREVRIEDLLEIGRASCRERV